MSNCFNSPVGTECTFSTLVELLCYRAQNQPDQIAFISLKGGEVEADKFTYLELHQQAQTIAASLQSISTPGDHALLFYPHGLNFIAAFFGCLYAGIVAVPAYPPRRNQNLLRVQLIAEDAQAKIVLTTTSLLETLQVNTNQVELSNLQWVTTDNLPFEQLKTWQEPRLASDSLAFLQYTSGSTGNPKGVMMSHGNLMHNSALIQSCFQDTQSSRGVSWLPLYHDMGLIGGVLQPIYVGAPMVLISPVDFLQKPYRWLQAVSRYKATTSGGPNFAYDLCLQKITPQQIETLDLSCWEVAFTGAEPVRAETLEKFAETFATCGFRKEAFYPCYGMAETTLIVSGGLKADLPVILSVDGTALEQNQVVVSQSIDERTRTIVGCGRSQLDQTVIIVHPETRTRCSEAQIGEIWVSGLSVAQGYWNRPEETEQIFCAHLADTGGPFLRTGDLGFLRDGELFVTGRLKDVIIIRGQNHYPQDIELTVERSHPALRPGCGAAFSIDFKGSERLVIVQEVERIYRRQLDAQEIAKSIRQAVAAHHGLDIFSTVLVKTGSIPKTSSGKIRRHACRAEFLTGTLDVIQDWSENPQVQSKFLNLQADVNSILAELQASKRT